MSQEHENLLEVNHLEEVLDEPGPPQPVVVVQYRSRAAAWLAIVSVVVAVALGSLLFYHFREVGASACRPRRPGSSSVD